ncbi:MAG: CRISPR-associated protein Cas4 [Magnetococcales bacterium]|nr:CRISPR-associated protein Cas4 [Magnetococcales bacterium]
MNPERRYAPLSALQHFVYCERQCALIHLEQIWINNRLTAEGNLLHEKVHEESEESRPGMRLVRGLPVVSETLGIIGQCDLVEFLSSRKRSSKASEKWEAVRPVEYKRGRPKSHEADLVQLCAQAISLEEMLGIPITEGALFYGEPRRRTSVSFTPELRATTIQTAQALHALLDRGVTPPALYRASLCRGCSLLSVCLPRRRETPAQAGNWFRDALNQILMES